MMDWDKLRIFHAVAEAGSFTHAGETLNLSGLVVSATYSNVTDPVVLDSSLICLHLHLIAELL